ncbi:hypothetical protein [Brachybacterium phenoliresistens]|uniref:hypothetical protein n=1 Tax=Brachybacterium phenoliresistens TaxID=396014 RepID=UPI0031D365F6
MSKKNRRRSRSRPVPRPAPGRAPEPAPSPRAASRPGAVAPPASPRSAAAPPSPSAAPSPSGRPGRFPADARGRWDARRGGMRQETCEPCLCLDAMEALLLPREDELIVICEDLHQAACDPGRLLDAAARVPFARRAAALIEHIGNGRELGPDRRLTRSDVEALRPAFELEQLSPTFLRIPRLDVVFEVLCAEGWLERIGGRVTPGDHPVAYVEESMDAESFAYFAHAVVVAALAHRFAGRIGRVPHSSSALTFRALLAACRPQGLTVPDPWGPECRDALVDLVPPHLDPEVVEGLEGIIDDLEMARDLGMLGGSGAHYTGGIALYTALAAVGDDHAGPSQAPETLR